MPTKNSAASAGKWNVTPVAVAIVLAIAGYAAGYKMGATRGDENAKAEGARAELESIRTKLRASGAFPEVRLTSLQGTVKIAESGSIDIEVAQTVMNPIDDPAPLVRHVTLAPGATVTRTVQKADPSSFAELDAYEKAVKAAREKGDEPPAPPTSYTSETIALGDLKAGDTVIVEAADDISRAASFAATAVRQTVRPAAAAPNPGATAPTPGPTPSAAQTPPPPSSTPPSTPTPPPTPPSPPPQP